MKDSILGEKAIAFAVRIVRLHQYLTAEKREYILSKQILRSGTSIGANITEGRYGLSRADFTAKMQIALKETAETEYWLRVLSATSYIGGSMSESLLADCLELKKLLISTLNTTKKVNGE